MSSDERMQGYEADMASADGTANGTDAPGPGPEWPRHERSSLGRPSQDRPVHERPGAARPGRRCVGSGRRRLEYDEAGRPVAASVGGQIVARYEYDERGWLVRDWSAARGWRKRLVTPEGRLLRLGDVYFDYDGHGRLESRDDGEVVRRYRWSAEGRLLRVAGTDGVVREYEYDGRGRRVIKRCNGRLVERYVRDGDGRLLRVEKGGEGEA